MRVRWYSLLDDILGRALVLGWNRAHKHTETPDPETIRDKQQDAFFELLGEVIEFNEEDLTLGHPSREEQT